MQVTASVTRNVTGASGPTNETYLLPGADPRTFDARRILALIQSVARYIDNQLTVTYQQQADGIALTIATSRGTAVLNALPFAPDAVKDAIAAAANLGRGPADPLTVDPFPSGENR